MSKRALIQIVLLCLFAVQVSCGGDSDISKIDFSTVPKNPIVITGPATVRDETIDANWFSLKIKVKNTSDKTLTIVSIKHIARVINDFGAEITTEFNSAPSDFNFSYTDGTTTCNYEFGSFDPILPNTNETFISVSGPEVLGTALCDPLHQSGPLLFYLGGNPTFLKDSVSSFSYSVDLIPIGWFGSFSNPEDRFEKQTFYQTQ